MDIATLRFVGSLNELLQPARRDRAIEQPTYDGVQSAKHLIEALGVPHTEVEWIVNNGRCTSFDYLVQPGDVLTIYPADSQPDVAPLLPLRPPLPSLYQFLLDNHLGRLARLMRLLGLDTEYFHNDLNDEQLAQRAADGQRILLTRDRGLLKRSLVVYGACLRSTDSEQQLRFVLARYQLRDQLRPWTRCLRCNGLLHPVAKETIIDRLEPRTKLYYDDFYACLDCSQIYWHGSHYAQLETFVSSVMNET